MTAAALTIRGARLHNLKNISLTIPRNRLVVLTGLSGSGKSTLGFDILRAEGQRQYLEALGVIPFGMARPPVDAISGLSPAVSVDQHLTNRSPRSTVGTSSDIYTYLRVLFARLGRRPCPTCGRDVPPCADLVDVSWEGAGQTQDEVEEGEKTFPCPHCGAAVPELDMAHFSFNKPAGACPTCSGLGVIHQANLARLLDEQKSLSAGAVAGWEAAHIAYHTATLQAASAHYGLDFASELAIKDYPQPQRDLLLFGVASPLFRRHFPGMQPPETVRQGRFEGVATSLLRRYASHIQEHQHDAEYRDRLEDFLLTRICPACAGARLRPESLAVTVDGADIVALSCLPLGELGARVQALSTGMTPADRQLAVPLLADLTASIARLVEIGLDYLTLQRPIRTLSAGEAQRLRLAALAGSELSGILYVFDEPTIGLHQRDTHRLIALLRRLRDFGNTVLVIEHDLDVIAAADSVVDFGPGAGRHGGQVVAQGSPAELARHPASLTAAYLVGRARLPANRQRPPAGPALFIRGARQHNLQNLTVRLPLGRLVAVTGVSGAGKSSLIFDVLVRAWEERKQPDSAPEASGYDALEGCEALDRLLIIDQNHLGRIPRSNAATYAEAFTPIREAFAATPQARRLGISARHFSFNVPGGRCERCEGAGVLTITMHFLPDVQVRCPACHGRRFTPQTLAVQYREHDIARVLELTVDEALALFQDVPAARSRLHALCDVGLGYLQLGQPATTLSGGEAQRVKLARELGRRASGRTLYLLDEPTTGLHLADVAHLLEILQRLVDAGQSVIVVEHNLDLVRAADWIIDLGPEGGAAGGRLIAEGTPTHIAQVPGSFTGQGLRQGLPRL